MASDQSHFHVSSLIVRDKVTRQCPHTTTCEKRGEPRSLCLPLTLNGQRQVYGVPMASYGPSSLLMYYYSSAAVRDDYFYASLAARRCLADTLYSGMAGPVTLFVCVRFMFLPLRAARRLGAPRVRPQAA